MFSCDHLNHPFQQDAGTGAADRLPGNLSGSSTPIDGRKLSDLLNYFSGLAGQIKFYKGDMTTSDWRSFFQNQLPFQLSQIDTYTGDKIKSGMGSAIELFQRNPSANGLQLLFLQTYYTAIFPVQQWSSLLPGDQDLQKNLNNLIKDRLLEPMQSFIKWQNTAVFYWHIQAPDLTGLTGNDVWGLTPALMAAYEEGFSPTIPSTRSQLMKVQSVLADIVNAFSDVVDLTVDGVADLVNNHLYRLLQNNGKADTPPHLAILYTFILQFQKVLQDLNGLTEKQLNFFFQEVLKLSPGPSIPDQAYVVFSIQKQLPSYTIAAANSSMKAGKDSKGADIYFQLNNDLTVNQAQVAEVRTVFINKQSWGDETYIEGVYMAPNAMMSDGISKPFTGTAAWPSLGAKQSLYTPPGDTTPIDYPFARLGFVIASKALFLKEGKRKIHIQLACQWAPGEQACSDGLSFGDLFPLAEQSVCARFAVLTPDIVEQAEEAGVSDKTVKALWQILLDPCGSNDLCDGAPPIYRDRYLFWVPCCSVPQQKPGGQSQPGTGGTQPGVGTQEPMVRENVAMKRVESFEMEGSTQPVSLDLSQRCPDEWEKVYCNDSASQALKDQLEKIAGKGSEDVTILQELLVLKNLFDVKFSGEKGWVAPDYINMKLETIADTQTFIWHIRATIETSSPSVVFYDKTKLGEDLHVTDPLVRIVLNNDISWKVDSSVAAATSSCLEEAASTCDQDLSPYEFFRNVALLPAADDPKHNTKIDVTVCGVKTLVVQNDANLMDVNKAFTPFGTKPLIPDFVPIDTGSGNNTHLGIVSGPNFYIGSQEVLLKKWTELYLNMSWLSKPASFTNYYSGYEPTKESSVTINDLDKHYTVSVAILENGIWHEQMTESTPGSSTSTGTGTSTSQQTPATGIPLFPKTNRSFDVCCGNKYDYSFYFKSTDFDDPVSMYDPDFAPIKQWVAGMQRGFLRLTLEQQDFLHKYYSWVLGRSMRFPKLYPDVINEPWTPTIVPGMSIDYKATATADDMALVQLYPFDGTSNLVNIYGAPSLMAKFCNEGNLFIGLTGLAPGQSLNMLFQLAEATGSSGTGVTDSTGQVGTDGSVSWQYLADNEWKPLRSGFEVVADGTQGLTRTGIIQFNFPDDLSNTSTVLPTGMFWIRAAMSKDTAATSRTMAIITQAGLATYTPVPDVNAPDRSATPLSAGSIAKLTQPDVNVIKIAQPYPSFGGSAPENSGDAYKVRVSERLRHRGRAIQQWDYERLVLQEFPMLSRVKCINHSQYLDSTYKYDFPMSPGNILVAVLPDTGKLAVTDAMQPTVPVTLLSSILSFLDGVKSPFVKVTVANPRYEPVTICATVEFPDGENKQARAAQLKGLITGLLSPWAGGDMSQFQFAQPLYIADVATLIQNQPYVAYLNKLTIHHAGDLSGTEQQRGYIAPRTPRSILVAGTVFINPATKST